MHQQDIDAIMSEQDGYIVQTTHPLVLPVPIILRRVWSCELALELEVG